MALLSFLGTLFDAFSVHLKKQDKATLQNTEAVAKLETVAKNIEETSKFMQDFLDQDVTNGPEGTVSDRTQKSVKMIASGITKNILQSLLISAHSRIPCNWV